MTEVKHCGRCNKNLPLISFAKNMAKKDGMQERCRSCRKEHHYNNRDAVAVRRKAVYCSEKAWERKIRHSYNLSKEAFLQLLDIQGNVCVICGSDDWGCGKKTNRPHVDHNHSTGKVRGLLCNNCNRCLGLLKEDTNVLKSMISYLDYYNE